MYIVCPSIEESGNANAEDEGKELSLLLRCLNLIVGEISCDYLPLIEQTSVEINEGKLDFSEYQHLPKLLSLTDLCGERKNQARFSREELSDELSVKGSIIEIKHHSTVENAEKMKV